MNVPDSRILCIDDDTNTSRWIRIMLKGSKVNAEVVTVKTGREAFIRLNEEEFDLCILEYALPDMTGVQLCSLIRQMGCNLPILFFTAMNRPVDREMAEVAGASNYLCKPDDLDLFVATVTNLLKIHRPVYGQNIGFVTLPKAA